MEKPIEYEIRDSVKVKCLSPKEFTYSESAISYLKSKFVKQKDDNVFVLEFNEMTSVAKAARG